MLHRNKDKARKLNQAEAIRQRFLRYGLVVAEVAKDAWIVGGRKKLRKYITKLELKIKV